MYQELIHEEEAEGFTIRFYALPEDSHPRDSFDDTCHDIAEICRKIDTGHYVWFTAKVTASKTDIELAADYLGACLYESCAQFVRDNDYYADMKDRVIEEAKQTIHILAEV
jgi:hypothetical protein